MLVERHRERNVTIAHGTAIMRDPYGLVYETRDGTSIEQMDDTHGNRFGANPLYGLKYLDYQWIVNGPNRTGDFLCIDYNNYPSMGAFQGWPQGAVTTQPTVSRAFVEGLAKTNPNRPFVDLPVFLFELRDIPHMVKEWGEDLLSLRNLISAPNGRNLAKVSRRVGQNYVGWEFGIKPYLTDVQKMVDVVGHVQKKFDQLKHLRQGASRRHATVWSETVRGDPVRNYVSSLYQESNEITTVVETNWDCWVSTTWSPLNPDSLPKSDDELLGLARRLAYGQDFSLAQLWEGMPWSWLIDWFGDIGDIFAATRNTIPCDHTGSCVMNSRTARRTDLSWYQRNNDSLTVTLPKWTIREIIRTPAPLVVYPEFSLPLFTGSQLSILSGIGAQRIRH